VAIPPLWHSIKFDWDRRRTGTEELMARWLEKNVPPGEGIMMETPAILLPARFRTDFTPSLLQDSLASYRERGVQYLVASTEKFDPSVSGGPRDEEYRRLFAATQVMAVVRRTRDHPGPTLTVLKLSDLDARDSGAAPR
jgi:hypothetical protein